ncbi:unnamed protein product [marine sediment metagenome]|uniref:Uncharacterized protein n=1 Tax=marine sediment metagenome TaxID=412755 RepID=X1DL24_9ZZZZ
MSREITKAKMLEYLKAGIAKWPPVEFEIGKLYSITRRTEGHPPGVVWCNK